MNLLKKHYKLAIIVLLTIAIGVPTYYTYKQSKDWVQLNDEKHDILNRNISLSVQLEEEQSLHKETKERLTSEQSMNAHKNETISFMSGMNEFILDIYADIEKLFLESDQNHLDYINWTNQNAWYSDVDTANYKLMRWENIYDQQKDDYIEILEKIDDMVNRIQTLEN